MRRSGRVSALAAAGFPASCCGQRGSREEGRATSGAPAGHSELAGGVLGEGVAQRSFVEAAAVGAEVVVVVHVVQHFTGQLLQSAETTRS